MGQRVPGLAHVNEKVRRAINYPLHREAYINNVLVLGQHQSLVTVGLNLGDIHNIHLINDRRIPMQAWPNLFIQYLTEAENYATLLLVHLIDAGKGMLTQGQ